MVKKIIFIAAALLVAIGIYYIFFSKTEADRVKQQFKYLSEYASKLPGEGGAAMLYKAKVVANVFDDYCDLTTDESFLAGHYSKEEISGKSLAIRKMFSSALITFHDLTIESMDDKKATVTGTVRLSGKDNNSLAVEQARAIEVLLLKKDGKWLISDFKIGNVLKK